MNSKPIAPASPLPWEYDCDYESRGEAACGKLLDANGKIVCDTLNSDVVLLESAYDGPIRNTWDENGRKNLLYAMHAVNCHAALVAACEMAMGSNPLMTGKAQITIDVEARNAIRAALALAKAGAS